MTQYCLAFTSFEYGEKYVMCFYANFKTYQTKIEFEIVSAYGDNLNETIYTQELK